MHLPIQPRASNDGTTSTTALIVAVICASTLFLLVSAFMYLRSVRRAYPNPKYVPTPFLKRRWRSWSPGSFKYGRIFHKSTSTPLSNVNTQTGDVDTSYHPSVTTNEPATTSLTETTTTPDNGIDRNTSIRSIMTLPPYRPAPAPSERLIAREGERAGVDTVIEFPETAEEEEQRREEDMDGLYQVRQARRHEQNERNERRRQRQAAREAGDWARLEQLRLERQMRTRARTGSGTSSPFASITNLNIAIDPTVLPGTRDRRVSSVSYASLGLARHDGSRIRADSVESNDQRPLLDSAASMGGSASGSRRSSLLTTHTHHQRILSAESILSVDSEAADTPYTSHRSGSDPPPIMLTPSASHGTESGSENNGEQPLGEPPRYEDAAEGRQPDEEAPPYTSPVAERGDVPRLPSIRRIPAIEVMGTTLGSSVPVTPIEGPVELPGEGRR